jgi:hypothetical protein
MLPLLTPTEPGHLWRLSNRPNSERFSRRKMFGPPETRLLHAVSSTKHGSGCDGPHVMKTRAESDPATADQHDCAAPKIPQVDESTQIRPSLEPWLLLYSGLEPNLFFCREGCGRRNSCNGPKNELLNRSNPSLHSLCSRAVMNITVSQRNKTYDSAHEVMLHTESFFWCSDEFSAVALPKDSPG